MYQFLAAKSAAALKRARPTRVMVGAIASGPIYRSNKPMSPLTPRIISNSDATMIAPCIWHQHKIPAKSYYVTFDKPHYALYRLCHTETTTTGGTDSITQNCMT